MDSNTPSRASLLSSNPAVTKEVIKKWLTKLNVVFDDKASRETLGALMGRQLQDRGLTFYHKLPLDTESDDWAVGALGECDCCPHQSATGAHIAPIAPPIAPIAPPIAPIAPPSVTLSWFDEYTDKYGLSPDTRQLMREGGIDNETSLRALAACITSSDDASGLIANPFQRALLVRALKEMPPTEMAAHSMPAWMTGVAPVAPPQLSAVTLLNEALLSNQPTSNQSAMAVKQGKPVLLLIPQFVDLLGAEFKTGATELRLSVDGSRLVLDDKPKEKPLSEISTAEFAYANTRIMGRLIADGQLPHEQIQGYLDHVELVTSYMRMPGMLEAALQYDQAVRMKIFEGKGEWGVRVQNAYDMTLQRQQIAVTSEASRKLQLALSASASTKAAARPTRATGDRSNEICRHFNGMRGCTRQFCRFAHVCSHAGCHSSTHGAAVHDGGAKGTQ